MKIGFDAKRVFHNFRGLGNYSRTLLEGLLEYYPEHEYHLYTPVSGDLRSIELQTRFSSCHIHTPQTFWGKLLHPFWRSFGMVSQIKAAQLQIYHGLSHEIPYGLKGTKTKKIVTVHDLIFLRYPEFFPWIDRRTYTRKVRYAAEQADVVVAICEQTKRDLLDFLYVPEAKIRVVYQAVSPDFYVVPSVDEVEQLRKRYQITRPFFIAVGALEPRKNLLTLIAAFAEIAGVVDHDLVIIGRGRWEYLRQLEAQIEKHKLENRVKILSGISQSELPHWYHAADAMVYPSIFEGFGLPIVEALFSRLPVVTSQGSCFPEAGGPDTQYVDPRSPAELAAAMQRVVMDRALHARMQANGWDYAQRFHLKNTSRELIKLYESL